MAKTKHPIYFLLFTFFLLQAFYLQGFAITQHHEVVNLPPHYQRGQGWKKWNSRRLMIGSTAPICTYNECRGCRFRCRAEQIPVDANDPINSAYHYRCVCHR